MLKKFTEILNLIPKDYKERGVIAGKLYEIADRYRDRNANISRVSSELSQILVKYVPLELPWAKRVYSAYLSMGI